MHSTPPLEELASVDASTSPLLELLDVSLPLELEVSLPLELVLGEPLDVSPPLELAVSPPLELLA